jgi:membrane protease YdiL (CAAX protease family)
VTNLTQKGGDDSARKEIRRVQEDEAPQRNRWILLQRPQGAWQRFRQSQTAAIAIAATALIVVAVLIVVVPVSLGSYVATATKIAGMGGGELANLATLIWQFSGVWGAVFLWVKFVEKRSISEFLTLPNRMHLLRGAFLFMLAGAVIGWPSSLLLLGRSIQAGAEELVCRGWLEHRARERLGVTEAVILSMLVFVYIHLPGLMWYQAVQIALFSLLMSKLARVSLWDAMLAHTVWNWIISY